MKIRAKHYNRGRQAIYRRKVLRDIIAALEINKSKSDCVAAAVRQVGKSTMMYAYMNYFIMQFRELKARVGLKRAMILTKHYV